jgi:hypothetical protein
MDRYVLLVALLLLAGCDDPADAGRSAGTAAAQRASSTLVRSAPVHALADYSQAVATGLMSPMLDKAQADSYRARHRAPPRALLVDEKCYGGTIIRQRVVDGVPTFEQPLQEGMPIACLAG